MPPQTHDLAGKTMGRWTVVSFAGYRECGVKRPLKLADFKDWISRVYKQMQGGDIAHL